MRFDQQVHIPNQTPKYAKWKILTKLTKRCALLSEKLVSSTEEALGLDLAILAPMMGNMVYKNKHDKNHVTHYLSICCHNTKYLWIIYYLKGKTT